MLLKSTRFSCLGCRDREVGCHETCEAYIAEKAKHDAKQDLIKSNVTMQRAFDNRSMDARKKFKRSKDGKKQ